MKVMKHVIVIGGGASGIVAAISASRQGADVTILEKNPRIGKKILATGNGRCNFTNVNTDISYYNGRDPGFAGKALADFGAAETISFFEKLGIEHKVEDQGKVFPMSDQASSILDVLMYELNELGVKIVCDSNVKDITKNHDIFIVKTENGQSYAGDAVIIASGGKAMPGSGSDGSGYDLAVKLGHRITDIFPALVQLMLEGSFFKRIDGVKFAGTAEVIYGNRSVVKDSGDILFTDYGVSGPPILQISRKAGELLNENKEVHLRISIMDMMPKAELGERIGRRFGTAGNKSVEFCLVGLVNKRLIPVLLKEAGIKDIKAPAANISLRERENIVNILTDWRSRIRGTMNWTNAQATAGGIDTTDIDPCTMGSRIVKELFFAGEIMDIDGQCGGYNLQWAWSSGYAAGLNAAMCEV